MTTKLKAGETIPELNLKSLSGSTITLGQNSGDADWQLLVVYRGKHCPLCTKYLKELSQLHDDFKSLKVEIVAVSADSKSKAQEHTQTELDLPFRVGYDLSIEQMKSLGLYISDPRSEQETDRPFAEPGIFVIRDDLRLQIIDISNAPFARPDLKTLHHGLEFIREKNYPIRGTH